MENKTAVTIEQVENWAQITLNQPPHNILTFEMIETLREHVHSLQKVQHLKLICIRGAGRSFCAGVDVAAHLAPHHKRMLEGFHAALRLLEDAAVPTVALVHGFALGGGCELALACDFVYAEETASFGQPEIRLAVFPPAASGGCAPPRFC